MPLKGHILCGRRRRDLLGLLPSPLLRPSFSASLFLFLSLLLFPSPVRAQYGRSGAAVPLPVASEAAGGYGRAPPGTQNAAVPSLYSRGVEASAGKGSYSPVLPPTNDVYLPPPEMPPMPAETVEASRSSAEEQKRQIMFLLDIDPKRDFRWILVQKSIKMPQLLLSL